MSWDKKLSSSSLFRAYREEVKLKPGCWSQGARKATARRVSLSSEVVALKPELSVSKSTTICFQRHHLLPPHWVVSVWACPVFNRPKRCLCLLVYLNTSLVKRIKWQPRTSHTRHVNQHRPTGLSSCSNGFGSTTSLWALWRQGWFHPLPDSQEHSLQTSRDGNARGAFSADPRPPAKVWCLRFSGDKICTTASSLSDRGPLSQHTGPWNRRWMNMRFTNIPTVTATLLKCTGRDGSQVPCSLRQILKCQSPFDPANSLLLDREVLGFFPYESHRINVQPKFFSMSS